MLCPPMSQIWSATLLRPICMRWMKKSSPIVCLYVPPKSLWQKRVAMLVLPTAPSPRRMTLNCSGSSSSSSSSASFALMVDAAAKARALENEFPASRERRAPRVQVAHDPDGRFQRFGSPGSLYHVPTWRGERRNLRGRVRVHPRDVRVTGGASVRRLLHSRRAAHPPSLSTNCSKNCDSERTKARSNFKLSVSDLRVMTDWNHEELFWNHAITPGLSRP